jgi:hypothetical protein
VALSSPRLVVPSLAALGAFALASAPSPARADGVVAVSPGLSFTVSFGQKVAFGLGLDVRVTGLAKGTVSPCDQDSRIGFGGFGQVTWLNFSAWRFAAGAHGGGEFYKQVGAVDGEIGWTYRTRWNPGESGEHGLHLGASALFTAGLPAPSVELPVRVAIPFSAPIIQPEFTLGAGARFPAVFGFRQTCIIGRPLRDGGDVVLPGTVALGEHARRALALDGSTRAALASAWLDDARGECASVPAFLALARDLAAAGAPSSLVARALAAADDEIRHTLLCREIAADHAGIDASPLLLAPPAAADADRRDALLRMAIEAWEDGCLGEGAAAARASRAHARAADPLSRGALAIIARDEAAHAELGHAVLAYCLRAGGSEVRDMLAESLAAPPAEPPRGDPERDADAKALSAHGRLPQALADEAWIENANRAKARAALLLSAA